MARSVKEEVESKTNGGVLCGLKAKIASMS